VCHATFTGGEDSDNEKYSSLYMALSVLICAGVIAAAVGSSRRRRCCICSDADGIVLDDSFTEETDGSESVSADFVSLEKVVRV